MGQTLYLCRGCKRNMSFINIEQGQYWKKILISLVILKWYTTAYAKFRHKLCDFSRFPVARTSINILSASSKVRIFKQYSLWGVRRLGLAACYNAKALRCINFWFCSKCFFIYFILACTVEVSRIHQIKFTLISYWKQVLF